MRAVIYTRVSTDEQAREGFSLAAQLDKCQKYIDLQGWEFIDEYKDEGYSAKNLKRPAMQRLIQEVKKGKFDLIVVYRLDRLVRHVGDLNHLLDLFKEHNVSFVSITEHFDTSTATGRLFMNNVASIAQWERENLSERVKMGKEQKALQGQRNGSPAPFGYQLDDKGRLIVDPYAASIVKRIFQMYLTYGAFRIRHILNKEGVVTAEGKKWSDYGISYIIRNPVYIGKIRYGYRQALDQGRKGNKDDTDYLIVESDHEPIISETLFQDVQRVRERRSKLYRKRQGKTATSDYHFSTALVCARCGGKMYGNKRASSSNHNYRFYRCANRVTYGTCNMPNLRESKIEEEFLKVIKDIFDEKDIQNFRAPVKETKGLDHNKVTDQLTKLRESRKKWQIAFGEGLIEIEELRALIEESKTKESKLLEMIEPDEDVDTPLSQEEFMQAIQDITKVWHTLDRMSKKQIIMELVDYMIVEAVDEGRNHINGSYKCRIIRTMFY